MTSEPDDATAPASGAARWRAAIGALVAIVLLAAAIRAIWVHRADLQAAFDSARGASPALVVLALTTPLVSWLTTSLAFWLLSRRHAPVPLSDMTALIGAAWLLNYLPFRAGMVGRVAFHKRYHAMAVRDSVGVMVKALVATGVSLAALLAAAALSTRVDSELARGAIVLAPTLLAAGIALGAGVLGLSFWPEAGAVAARSLDMLAWAARYLIAFELLGRSITLPQAAAITAVSQAAMLVPITGAGLGLREWAVAITAGVLPAFVIASGSQGQATALALAADLLNRAAETLVALPAGLVSVAFLGSRVRALTPRDPRRIRAPGDDPTDSHPRTDSGRA